MSLWGIEMWASRALGRRAMVPEPINRHWLIDERILGRGRRASPDHVMISDQGPVKDKVHGRMTRS